ncbi:hypothetical protein AV521_00585 [Streptomyces sp. IMTB 2501]|uniref:hypothetical protein n=1 Tax=Streptomyces sp. IMTB 2501 TaxID=1776340 RepID=UPI00096DA170|nr:hypothetical protein [Streptomyces sp. IMTB 2501]OLZ74229.1 hypothetical protein AV521_00585 [Streptomyces sp. IMTB 2501]
MSRIKDYIELEDSVLDAAEDAAHHEDVKTRLRAIQHLFEAIGEHVNRSRFHDKPKVVGILVRRAAETYVNARRELHADMRTAA